MKKTPAFLAALISLGLVAQTQAAIKTLNGLATTDQTFATSSNNSNVNVTSVGTIHTINWVGILQPARGGTGASSFATGSVPFFLDGIFKESAAFVWDNVNSLLTVQHLKVSSSVVFLNPLTPSSGGTGQSAYAKGDILVGQPSSTLARLGVGSDGKVLTANSAAPDGVSWEPILSPSPSSKFGGTGADGELSLSSGVTTIDLGGSPVFVRDYTLISITDTALLNFTNPSPAGTVIIFKSQGDVTITSTNAPAVDISGMGSVGFGTGTFIAPPGGSSPSGNGCGCGACTQAAPSAGVGVPTVVSVYGKGIVVWTGAGGGGNGGGGLGCVIGRGGGGMYFEVKGNLDISSVFWAKGVNGGNYIPGGSCSTIGGGGGGGSFSGGSGGGGTNSGGCGGGGGGMFLFLYNGTLANSASFNVSGGSGGSVGGGTGGTGTYLIQQNTEF